MKTVFVNPPGPKDLFRGSVCTYLSKADYVWKPKDFIILSSLVPPSDALVFVDAAINSRSADWALEKLMAHQPDAIVLALSSIQWAKDLEFLREVRKLNTAARIYVFGEALMEPVLKAATNPWVDEVISNPLWFDFASGRNLTPNASYRKTFLPRHELFEHPGYRWPFSKKRKHAAVVTQYGCPHACTYCTESINESTFRPAENVIEELSVLAKRGYREFYFADASFGYPRENTRRIIEGLKRSDHRWSWSTYLHPAQGDVEMLRLMADSGCHTIVVGIDSADENLLSRYGRKVATKRVKELVINCRRNDIAVCGDIMIGFPGESLESCHATINLAMSLGLDFLSVNVATPLMGSSIRKELIDAGVMKNDSVGLETSASRGALTTGELSPKQLYQLRRMAILKFYFRPAYLLRRLLRTDSIEELAIQIREGWAILRRATTALSFQSKRPR